MRNTNFPFSAITGNDELVLAIILNLINPRLGGLLIRNAKDTSINKIINSIPNILQPIDVMLYCEYNCDPSDPASWCNDCLDQYTPCTAESEIKEIEVISVPTGINNDQLLGYIRKDIYNEEGELKFMPGLLAKVHRNILYMRDISNQSAQTLHNIFDISSIGWNRVYFDSSLIEHPSQFLLLGTIHPQKEDTCKEAIGTFPLAVSFETSSDPILWHEIIKRCLSFQEDPDNFTGNFSDKNEDLKNLITDAGIHLNSVTINKLQVDHIIKSCIENKIDGYKPVIMLIKTALTYAAFELKLSVEKRHLVQAARFTLGHITRDNGRLEPLSADEINQMFEYTETSDPEVFEKDYETTKSMFNINDLFQPFDKEINI